MKTKIRVLIEVFEDGSASTTVYDHNASIEHVMKAKEELEKAKSKLNKKFNRMLCEPILLV